MTANNAQVSGSFNLLTAERAYITVRLFARILRLGLWHCSCKENFKGKAHMFKRFLKALSESLFSTMLDKIYR